MTGNSRRAARLTGQAVAIGVITVLLAEVALRGYAHFTPLFVFYDDSYNRFRGRPNADAWGYQLNTQGFNDVEFGKKQPGIYRIVGLGDSFAHGVVPYPHNYLTVLESELRSGGKPTEVLNLGIPSTGPREYLSVLVREGLALDPDMVLLSFFIGNDIFDSHTRPRTRKLYEYSYLASLVRYALTIRPKYQGRNVSGGHYCDDCPSMERGVFLEIQERRAWQYLTNRRSRLVPLLDSAGEALDDIRNLCRQRGIELLVVIIPAEIQVNGALQGEIAGRVGGSGGWNSLQPNQLLAERLRRLGIDFVDLHGVLLERSSSQRLYKPQDTHWNLAGNALAASSIAAHILAQDHRSTDRVGR